MGERNNTTFPQEVLEEYAGLGLDLRSLFSAGNLGSRMGLEIVEAGPDVADDWIAERVEPGDIVVTNDIPLADRVLKAGGAAIAPNGRPFTPDAIGGALAQRAIMEHIRSTGEITGGPRPFGQRDRSRFLQALDEAVNRERRTRR